MRAQGGNGLWSVEAIGKETRTKQARWGRSSKSPLNHLLGERAAQYCIIGRQRELELDRG